LPVFTIASLPLQRPSSTRGPMLIMLLIDLPGNFSLRSGFTSAVPWRGLLWEIPPSLSPPPVHLLILFFESQGLARQLSCSPFSLKRLTLPLPSEGLLISTIGTPFCLSPSGLSFYHLLVRRTAAPGTPDRGGESRSFKAVKTPTTLPSFFFPARVAECAQYIGRRRLVDPLFNPTTRSANVFSPLPPVLFHPDRLTVQPGRPILRPLWPGLMSSA